MLKDQLKKSVEWSSESDLGERLKSWSENASAASRLLTQEPLSRHSSLRIGGPAANWIEVGAFSDFWPLLAAFGGESVHCVGLGSNTLFPDAGIKAPVLRLVGELAQWSLRMEEGASRAVVEVMAGAINAHLVRGLLKEGWIGAEFLKLIPGTFGGAVALNAGTKDKELASVLKSVWLAVPDGSGRCWRLERRSVRELAMSYRRADIPKGSLIIGGALEVLRGDVEVAKSRVKADKEQRDRTQPYRLASVGSTFANPPGDYAGRLIEAVGLKGEAVGGARISSQHANFFINESDATADDFLRLMALARHRVRRDFGIELRPEVRFIGFDGRAKMRDLEQQWAVKDV